jgi:hypothetical protein
MASAIHAISAGERTLSRSGRSSMRWQPRTPWAPTPVSREISMLVLEQRAMSLVYESSWGDGCLF